MMPTILLLESVAEEADALLRQRARVFTAWGERPLADILSTEPVDAIITRGKGLIDGQLLDQCPSVKVVARCGVGLDNVDVTEATRRGIRVVNAPGSNAATIAEHTLMLMLMAIRNGYRSAEAVRTDNWAWRNQYAGDELSGKTLGILGLGNIGGRVARLGEAFGMNVVTWSRRDTPYPALSLEEVLQQSDVISLHLPLTDETRYLFDAARFSLLKPGAILVNTARGALIERNALLSALNSGQLAAFAADVLEEEPPAVGDVLVHHPNAVITPHSGSLTATTYRAMCLSTVRNVLAILYGEPFEAKSVFNRKEL